MRLISGTSMGMKKMVAFIELSTYLIFGETGQLRRKKGRVKTGTKN